MAATVELFHVTTLHSCFFCLRNNNWCVTIANSVVPTQLQMWRKPANRDLQDKRFKVEHNNIFENFLF
jgi:hypothetical protein